MDIKLLQKVLSCTTVPAINRASGIDFALHDSIYEIKQKILEEACSERHVEICHSIEDQMETILSKDIPYTEEQEKIIAVLHKNGYVAKATKPDLVEEAETAVSESSHMSDAMLSESTITEAKKVNLELKNLVDKIAMCPDFSSLLEMKEDFHQIGMEIRNTNNDRVMLCYIQEEDAEDKKLKIFEDYMLVGSEKDPNKELTDRFVECLTKFVKTSLNRNRVVPAPAEPKKHWTQTKASTYGDAIGMVMEDSTKQ